MGFKERIIDLGINLTWRQWSTLGVAGHAGSHDDRRIIDPEALLLMSTVVGRQDPRLFDEVMDWLILNAGWINLQRLGTLQKEYDIGEPSILAAMAEHISSQSEHTKWKKLLKLSSRGDFQDDLEPLFPDVPQTSQKDEVFKQFGWNRPPLRIREMSRFPDVNHAGTFLFKLRALFGRQARSEIIAWFLHHDSGHPAEVARDLGYTRRTVQLVLNEMLLSGHVTSSKQAREKKFSFDKEDWRFLKTWSNTKEFPEWYPWARVFALFVGLYRLVTSSNFHNRSANFNAIEVGNTLDERLIAETELSALIRITKSKKGSDYLESVAAVFESELA